MDQDKSRLLQTQMGDPVGYRVVEKNSGRLQMLKFPKILFVWMTQLPRNWHPILTSCCTFPNPCHKWPKWCTREGVSMRSIIVQIFACRVSLTIYAKIKGLAYLLDPLNLELARISSFALESCQRKIMAVLLLKKQMETLLFKFKVLQEYLFACHNCHWVYLVR